MLHKINSGKTHKYMECAFGKTCSTVVQYISFKNNFQYVHELETFIQHTLSEFKAIFLLPFRSDLVTNETI